MMDTAYQIKTGGIQSKTLVSFKIKHHKPELHHWHVCFLNNKIHSGSLGLFSMKFHEAQLVFWVKSN